MKVAHFLNFAPHAAGIYGTAKDMVLAERKVEIDAQAIDYGNGLNPPQRHSRVGCKDGEMETINPDWAMDADIVVRHSALPQKIFDAHKPIVMPLHGAPEYTFLLEHMGNSRVLKEILVSAQNKDYKAFITFWKENIFYWRTLLPKTTPIFYVPPSVDLNHFQPGGKVFDFGSKAGDINIVAAGVWRKEYTTPYSVIFAAAKWVHDKHPNARIHVCGLPNDNKKYPKNDGPVNRTMLALQKDKLVGNCYRIIGNLDEVYRSADIAITQHTIASRTVREALASGCPLVAAAGNKYTPYAADPRDTQGFADAIERCYQDIVKDRAKTRKAARQVAEKEFNLKQVGAAMKRVFTEVLKNG